MNFEISTDKSRLDRDLVYRWISETYWAKGIPRATVERSIENSICFGVYENGALIGFARVISDCATFAYVGDVFVVESHRGRGASKLLMQTMLAHPDLQGLRRWFLMTRDAHGLYEQFGFKVLPKPDRAMELHDPLIYERVSK